MMKKLLSVICFLAITIGLFHAANIMLFEKQHFGTAKNIAHEESEKIDVFFIGASHVFYGVNPMKIWDDSGIAAFNLTTHQQPLWSSKLLLQYALKQQHPKLIVLDVLMATNFGRPLIGTEQGTNMTHLALDPVPLSLQKIKGVLETDSITEKGEILLPIILNHSRLQQGLLTYDDLHFFFGDRSHPMKGYNYTQNTLPYERPEVPDPSVTYKLPEGMEAVLIDFIEFCRAEGLPLLFIKTPLVGNEELYGQINRIGEIAAAYEVPFVDFNHLYDELDIDFSSDFADSGHLNVRGAEKVSAYLTDYLSEHYTLPDHRGEADYASWEQAYRHFAALTGLNEHSDVTDFFRASSDPHLLTVVLSGGSMEEPVELPEEVRMAMSDAGLSQVPDVAGKGGYYAVIQGGRVLIESKFDSGIRMDEVMVKDTRFSIRVSTHEPDGGSFLTALYIDKGGYRTVEPGMMIVTYDTDRMEPVAAVRYAFDASLQLERVY